MCTSAQKLPIQDNKVELLNDSYGPMCAERCSCSGVPRIARRLIPLSRNTEADRAPGELCAEPR